VQYIIKLNYANGPAEQTAGNFTTPASTFVWPTSVKTTVQPAMVNGVVVDPSRAVRVFSPTSPVVLTLGASDKNTQENLANGNIVMIVTGEVNDGVSTNYLIYKNYAGTNCIRPVRSDTGVGYGNSEATSNCFTGDAPTYVIGTDDPFYGILYRSGADNGNRCSLYGVKGTKITPCPF
jgi:hypothetical protein